MSDEASEPDGVMAAVDLSSTEEVSNYLKAEEILDERLVARVLRLTWDEENDGTWVWSSGCSECDKELHAGEPGWIWGRPLGDQERSPYVTLATFCSEECAREAVTTWAARFKKDLITGFYTL